MYNRLPYTTNVPRRRVRRARAFRWPRISVPMRQIIVHSQVLAHEGVYLKHY